MENPIASTTSKIDAKNTYHKNENTLRYVKLWTRRLVLWSNWTLKWVSRYYRETSFWVSCYTYCAELRPVSFKYTRCEACKKQCKIKFAKSKQGLTVGVCPNRSPFWTLIWVPFGQVKDHVSWWNESIFIWHFVNYELIESTRFSRQEVVLDRL